MQFVLGPVHTYPNTFESATRFFFSDSTFSTSTLIRIQIEFARPNVSGFSLVPRTSLEILATEHASYSARNESCSIYPSLDR